MSLSEEQKQALIDYLKKTPKKEIEEFAAQSYPKSEEFGRQLTGEGTFRDTGRQSSSPAEAMDAMTGAPLRRFFFDSVRNGLSKKSMIDAAKSIGTDPSTAPTGYDVASGMGIENPYLGAAVATGVDLANLPFPAVGVAGEIKGVKNKGKIAEATEAFKEIGKKPISTETKIAQMHGQTGEVKDIVPSLAEKAKEIHDFAQAKGISMEEAEKRLKKANPFFGQPSAYDNPRNAPPIAQEPIIKAPQEPVPQGPKWPQPEQESNVIRTHKFQEPEPDFDLNDPRDRKILYEQYGYVPDQEELDALKQSKQKTVRQNRKDNLEFTEQNYTPEALTTIDQILARYPDDLKKPTASVLKKLEEIEGIDHLPYVGSKHHGDNAPNISLPNFNAKPTGIIGEPHINGGYVKEADPFSWMDDKYKAAKQLLQRHNSIGMPAVINTSSDLISKPDYIQAIPPGSTVNLYMLTNNASLNRRIFPGNASQQRLEDAAQKLKEAGIKVNKIYPSVDDVIKRSVDIYMKSPGELLKVTGYGSLDALKQEIAKSLPPKIVKPNPGQYAYGGSVKPEYQESLYQANQDMNHMRKANDDLLAFNPQIYMPDGGEVPDYLQTPQEQRNVMQQMVPDYATAPLQPMQVPQAPSPYMLPNEPGLQAEKQLRQGLPVSGLSPTMYSQGYEPIPGYPVYEETDMASTAPLSPADIQAMNQAGKAIANVPMPKAYSPYQDITGAYQKIGAQEAAQAKAQADILTQERQADEELRKDWETRTLNHQQDIEDAYQDYKEGRINPNQFMESMSSGQRVMTAIGLILGGISAGMTGQENPAMKFLQSQIDRDIESQRINLQRKGTLLGVLRDKYGSMKDAMEMTKLYNAKIYAGKMQEQALRMGGPIALERAKLASAQLLMPYMQQAMMIEMGQTAENALEVGGQIADVAMARLQALNPEKYKDLQTRYVPGIGVAAIPVDKEVRKEIMDKQTFMNLLGRAQDLIDQHGNSISMWAPAVQAEAQVIGSKLQGLARESTFGGVWKESEQKMLNKLAADNPLTVFASWSTLPQYKELKREAREDYNLLLKTYGFKKARGMDVMIPTAAPIPPKGK